MKTEGIVKALNKKGEATVVCTRESACDGCHKKEEGSCSVCSLLGAGQKMEVCVRNSLQAHVGDRVALETVTGRVLLYATLTFLVPVVLLLLVYFALSQYIAQTGICIAVSVGTFALYFILLRLFSEKWVKRREEIRMTAILQQDGEQRVSEPIESENNK